MMIKIFNDKQATSLIERYNVGDFSTEDERDIILDSLEEYQAGISNVLTQSEKILTPFKALRLARERNKPIIL